MTELICVYDSSHPCPPWWTQNWIKQMQNVHTGRKISKIDAAASPKICSEYRGLPTNPKSLPAYLFYENSHTPLTILCGDGDLRQAVEDLL